jgi:predicted DNA binding protein
VLCYWAARELKITTVELSKRLSISQPTASQSVKRGERVVVEKKLKLIS